MENRATDLGVFGATGGLRERTEVQLRVWCFSTSEHHSRGQERIAANFERWKQPQRASSQSCALDPLQWLSPNTLPGSPPLTGEEPWLVYLSYKQLFIMKNFKHTQNKQKSLTNPVSSLSTFYHYQHSLILITSIPPPAGHSQSSDEEEEGHLWGLEKFLRDSDRQPESGTAHLTPSF